MQSNATARCSSAGWSPKASSRLLLLVAVLAAAAAAAGKRYRVGGPDGWVVPPPDDKELYYVRWASSMTFYIGDSIALRKGMWDSRQKQKQQKPIQELGLEKNNN
ncbi:hypothetical protein E2562_029781 [Oryza meyeriana var. granulata]|uniref:Phytocyanin domain-containing protein n=1 Tax=Oryza meyeriana var. granulata TaxID=110450 RepID=A0A6G1E389_9ORYZ|nr:hypothetical protein E2562_029781 [Oryza meyeriana var. granulata]